MTDSVQTIINELLKTSHGVTVTTLTEDQIPETRMIFNLLNPEDFPGLKDFFNASDIRGRLLYGTNTSSEKVSQLKKNNMLTAYYTIPDQFKGMMIHGTVTLLNDPDLKKRMWLDGWDMYYHQGPLDPDYTIFELFPRYVKGWYEGRPFHEKFE